MLVLYNIRRSQWGIAFISVQHRAEHDQTLRTATSTRPSSSLHAVRIGRRCRRSHVHLDDHHHQRASASERDGTTSTPLRRRRRHRFARRSTHRFVRPPRTPTGAEPQPVRLDRHPDMLGGLAIMQLMASATRRHVEPHATAHRNQPHRMVTWHRPTPTRTLPSHPHTNTRTDPHATTSSAQTDHRQSPCRSPTQRFPIERPGHDRSPQALESRHL